MTSLLGEHSVGKAEKIHHIFLMCHRQGGLTDSGLTDRRGSESTGNPTSLVAAFEKAGYQVTQSVNPLDTNRLLRKVRPSVLILDPMVCTADGVEFEMAAQVQRKDDPVPILVLAQDLIELREIRKVPALFKDFLVKPFTDEEILTRVELLLASKERYLSLQLHALDLEGQIIRDFKTGLYTERHFRHLLRQEFQRAERHRTPLSFLLIDVDNFKQINDQFDYSFGDFVLLRFAEILQRNVRDIDHLARFGGDEFMLLLPNTRQAEAVQVGARIRRQMAATEFDNGRHHTLSTVSIGIATYDGRGQSSADELRRQANLALKECKKRGKNRLWLHSDPASSEKAALSEETGEPEESAADIRNSERGKGSAQE